MQLELEPEQLPAPLHHLALNSKKRASSCHVKWGETLILELSKYSTSKTHKQIHTNATKSRTEPLIVLPSFKNTHIRHLYQAQHLQVTEDEDASENNSECIARGFDFIYSHAFNFKYTHEINFTFLFL